MEISFEWSITLTVLGPILFLIYINDLEEGVTSKILKVNILWSEKWQTLFSFEKCKCLHAGHGNIGVNYEMGGTYQCEIVKENDLRVTISANMKVSEQSSIVAYHGK